VLKKLQSAGSTYSPYNINVFNELFYRYAEQELINELPNLFTELDLFNIALHKKITTELNSNVIIKVMELASGKKMDRWKTFVKIDKKHKWRVLLTDFDKTLLPNLNTIKSSDNFNTTASSRIPRVTVLGDEAQLRRRRSSNAAARRTGQPRLTVAYRSLSAKPSSSLKNLEETPSDSTELTEVLRARGGFTFITDIYSLFNSFPKLKPSDMYDVMLSTYTFDNLWLADDLHLTKVNNAWYKNLYQLDLSKIEESLGDIKKGKKLDRQFFKDLRIETKTTKINLSYVQHGAHIDEYYKNYKHVSVNYPGGLIKTVVNSYHNQLKKEGIFITADIATADKGKKIKAFENVNETIKIKIENYDLAKYILEKLGYNMELKNLHQFVKEAGIVTPVKIYDHFVLTVKKV